MLRAVIAIQSRIRLPIHSSRNPFLSPKNSRPHTAPAPCTTHTTPRPEPRPHNSYHNKADPCCTTPSKWRNVSHICLPINLRKLSS